MFYNNVVKITRCYKLHLLFDLVKCISAKLLESSKFPDLQTSFRFSSANFCQPDFSLIQRSVQIGLRESVFNLWLVHKYDAGLQDKTNNEFAEFLLKVLMNHKVLQQPLQVMLLWVSSNIFIYSSSTSQNCTCQIK